MLHKKILLVDDSSTTLMMEKFILRNDPFILITATNGEEAVRKAASEKPDLILLDVIMPRMSGYDACRLIREHEELKHVPIIMVTTCGEDGSVETDCTAGYTDFVTKPINAVELLVKVRRLLSAASGAVQ